jgi:hypothetical protein
VVGAYCTVTAGDVLTMRHLSSLPAWEGCGLRREWTGDMRAEARPVPVPAEEVLAAACFACDQIMTLDARIRIANTSCAREAPKPTGNLQNSGRFEADYRHRLGSADAHRVLATHLGPLEAGSLQLFRDIEQRLLPLTAAFGLPRSRARHAVRPTKKTPQKSEVKEYEVKRK